MNLLKKSEMDVPCFQSSPNNQCDQESTESEFNRIFRNEPAVQDLLRQIKLENDWLAKEETLSNDNMTEGNFNGNDPICPGHPLSLQTSVLLIWLYIVHCSLTADQVSGLLSLLNLHFLVAHPGLRSLYSFKHILDQMQSPFVKHFYCSTCFSLVMENAQHCTNQLCPQDFSGKGSKGYFLEFPVLSQLYSLFPRKVFIDQVNHAKTRAKKVQENIEDIYDGSVYKYLRDSHKFNKRDHFLTFTMNTDGIPIFKSSQTSKWPIFLMINELPLAVRKQQENMLLCALWFGQSKPQASTVFNPLHELLKNLKKGVDVNAQGRTLHVKGHLICMSCDIPARSMVLNMNQHNGEYSCIKCVQSGANHCTQKGGNVRVFPYQVHPDGNADMNTKFNHVVGPQRSATQSHGDGEKAVTEGQVTHGIKGSSFLMECPGFDYVKGVSIDYTPLVFLGVVRLLMKLMFSPAHANGSFSLSKLVDLVDDRLSNIKPSHLITRVPRSISDSLKFWKGAELRSWFFYYSIPGIYDLPRPDYLYHYHYAALVEGIYLLCQDSISETDICRREELLHYFVFMMAPLYGERYLTINVHSLLHLPQTVRELGPSWSTSCFVFESANGDLLNVLW